MAFVVLALSIAFVIVAIAGFKLHPFLALVAAAVLVGVLSPRPLSETAAGTGLDPDTAQAILAVELTARGFGATAAAIGIVIVLAAIIGQCLVKSGAADKIVRTFLEMLGEGRAGVSLVGSGYLLSIPVFFDTVFLLLVPIARSLRRRTGRHYALYVMAICIGSFITHSLVPPTPGPLVMADTLNLDLSVAILGGLLLGVVPAAVALAIAPSVDAKLEVPLRGDVEEEGVEERALPGFVPSVMPVLAPVVLIAGHSFVELLATGGDGALGALLPWTGFFGNKNVALLMGTVAATWVLKRQSGLSIPALARTFEPAVTSAGVIILITCAGGAFGSMLARIGIDESLQAMAVGEGGRGYLLVAFAIAAVMKIAQGSGTVSIITTAAIMAALVPEPGTLPFHILYIYAAIGFGSGIVSWMNDSGFWVVCKMSRFTERETFSTWSLALVAIGVVGLIEVLILSAVLPLV